MKPRIAQRRRISPLLFCLNIFALTSASAQQTQPAKAAGSLEEEVVALSPFVVTSDKDNGYQANSTLAGSRLNTALRDTPAPISVMTKAFLDDIGALNVGEALQYSLNGARDLTDVTALQSTQYNNVQVKLRGFTGGSLTRNFFPILIPMDTYNIERLDFARGPNSILFGIGGPAGVVDTSTKFARLNTNLQEVQFRVGSWDDYRGSFDINRKFGENFSVRVNAVMQNKDGWRDFEFSKKKAEAIAATWRPWKNTEIRVEGEYYDIQQLVAYPWAAADAVTPWLAGGKQIAATNTQAVAGTALWGSNRLFYDPTSPQGFVSWFNTRYTPPTPPFIPSQGGQPRPITDETILPRSANLMGPGNTSNNNGYAYSAFLDQRIGEDLSVQLAVNKQHTSRLTKQSTSNQLQADPNALLPNNPLPNGQLPVGGGLPNPHAGQFYVLGNSEQRPLLWEDETARVTFSYKLDLTKKNKWLGSYTFAGLAAYNKDIFFTDEKYLVNVSGNSALYPVDVTSGNNLVYTRTYLDFNSSNPALRGSMNPDDLPTGSINGVTLGYRRIGNSSSKRDVRTDSGMLAGQANYLNNRIVLTGGVRRDVQTTKTTNGAKQDPITKEWSLSTFDAAIPLVYGGNTKTYGAVVHLTKVVSVFYNKADNFGAQIQRDVTDKPLGSKLGKGQDYGFRLELLNNRINFTADHYETAEANKSVQATQYNTIVAAANAIWRGIGKSGAQIGPNIGDSVDNVGEGWEYELTANPLKNWRVSANYSHGTLAQSNTAPRYGEYIATHRAEWQQNAAVLIENTFPSASPTPNVAEAVAVIDAAYTSLRLPEGRIPRQFVADSVNVFTAYTVDFGPPWLKGLTVGGGANYRGRAVVGYNTTTFAPVYGNKYVLLNGLVSKSFRLNTKTNLKVQLNVDNLLDEDDPIIIDKDNTGTYRSIYITPRRWAVTTTLNF